jgi:hypothetical protein
MSSAYEPYKAYCRSSDALYAASCSLFLCMDLLVSVDYEAYQEAGNLREELERFRAYLRGRKEASQTRLDLELGALKASKAASRG